MKTKTIRIVTALIIFAIILMVCYFIITYLLLPLADNPDYAGLAITLTFSPTGCVDGPCTQYTVQILGNGEGTYNSMDRNLKQETRTFKVSRFQLAKLIRAVESANYFSLKSEYRDPHASGEMVTSTSISFRDSTKTVVRRTPCDTAPNSFNLDPAPPTLCALENKINEIANSNK